MIFQFRDKGGKKVKLSVSEAGGETKIHKGGGRRTPCVPPAYWNLTRILAISSKYLESYPNVRKSVSVFTKISDVFCSNIAYNCLTTSTLESKTSLKSSSLRYA